MVDDPRAVLGDRRLARVRRADPAELTTIGITGTAGKTSTAYLIEAGLRAAGQVTGLIGTVETRLGDLTIDSARTTPEATDLHALFAAALERGVEAVVMEVSSHALELGRVNGVGSPPAATPTSAWTTSTSTPTSRSTSRPRPACSTAAPRSRS